MLKYANVLIGKELIVEKSVIFNELSSLTTAIDSNVHHIMIVNATNSDKYVNSKNEINMYNKSNTGLYCL